MTLPDTDTLLVESASRLFAAHPTTQAVMEHGRFPDATWDAIVEAGLHGALLPDHAGGFGLAPHEAMGVLRIAGEHIAHAPLAETMLAGWLLAGAGLEVPGGPLTVAPVLPTDSLTLQRDAAGWRLRGVAHRLPWGRDAATIAVTALFEGQPHTARVPNTQWRCEPGTNIALEPRDTITFDAALPAEAAAPGPAFAQLEALGAAMRSLKSPARWPGCSG